MTKKKFRPDGYSRRDFLKIGGGATALGATGMALPGPQNPTQRAEAIVPALVGVAAGTAIAVDWAIGQQPQLLKSDPPTSDLTADLLREQSFETLKKRKSSFRSTIIDNKNIVEFGFRETLYSEAKIAATKAINNGLSESEVHSAADNAINSHATIIEKNFLKSWEEYVSELIATCNQLRDHSSVSVSNVVGYWHNAGEPRNDGSPTNGGTSTVTLSDGSNFDVTALQIGTFDYYNFDPVNGFDADNNGRFISVYVFSQTDYQQDFEMINSVWIDTWDMLQQQISDANTGIDTWITNTYEQVSSGDLNTADMLSNSDLRQLAPDDQNMAYYDLVALNAGINQKYRTMINIPDLGIDLVGNLAFTGEGTLTTGIIDPQAQNEDYYFTYDISEPVGEWQDYQTLIDGGVLTFTSEPYSDTKYTVYTTHDETVNLLSTDFNYDSTNGVWTVDISGLLNNPITDVAKVEYSSQVEETTYETIQLKKPFEILKFVDSEGNEYGEAEFTRTDPQNDSNYVTQEEWDQMVSRYEDTLDEYQTTDNTDGTGFDISGLSLFGLPGETVAVGAAGLVGLIALLNQN